MLNDGQLPILLTDAIANHARFSPNDIALICEDDRLTWRDLDLRTRKVANSLIAQGLQKGDHVGFFMSNQTIAFEILWGIIRAGGVVVSLNTQFHGDPLASMINLSDSTFLIAEATLTPQIVAIRDKLQAIADDRLFEVGGGATFRAIEPLIDAAPDTPVPVKNDRDDSITIVFSSGSTGQPKGSEHSHFARLSFAMGLGPPMGIYDRYTVALVTTPLYTNGTWMTMAPTIFYGGTIVLAPKFSPEAFLDLVEREKCTMGFMVPTQFIAILASPDLPHRDVSSLRGLCSAGQALLPATHEELAEKMPGVRIYEAYGMSEGFGTIAVPEDFLRGKRGSVGKPFFVDDLAILDEAGNILPPGTVGEIAGFSAGMMKGYYNAWDKTEAAIWRGENGRILFRSGDLGYLDEDGFLYISGRLKDMIKSGGINIFASDIEAVFMKHPAVSEVAAIGIPHAKWGETPILLVLLKEGASVDAEALRGWGNDQLAKYQRVSAIEIRDTFARAQYGKINKTVMREPYWEADTHAA